MILIINGPNLNLTGKREPEIYGSETFEHYLERLRASMPEVRIEYFQSNSEGALIDRVQAAGADAGCEGIVINPGGYSHYSIALADALRAVATPAIEVHISNIHAREGYRATTVTGAACRGVIAGLGLDGYRLAVGALCASRQESRVKSEESRVKSEESRVKSQESRVKSQESRVKSQESRVKSQESRVKSQESRVKSQESRVKSQE